MPYTGTISVLTFYLINSLAKQQTRSMDRGPRTGVTGAVCHSDLDTCQRVGWISGLSSCASDLGSGIGGGGGWLVSMVAVFAILTGARAELSFRSMGDVGVLVPSHPCVIVFGRINFSHLAKKLLAKSLFERIYI